LEVFLAMILVAVVIFAMVGLYPGAMGSMTRAHNLVLGSNVTMAFNEGARAQPFNTLTNTGWGTFMEAPSSYSYDSNNFSADLSSGIQPTYQGDPNVTLVTGYWDWNGTSHVRLDSVVFNELNPP
jgi:hypothetical protein